MVKKLDYYKGMHDGMVTAMQELVKDGIEYKKILQKLDHWVNILSNKKRCDKILKNLCKAKRPKDRKTKVIKTK